MSERIGGPLDRIAYAIDERLWRLERRLEDRRRLTVPPGQETRYARQREAGEWWRRQREESNL